VSDADRQRVDLWLFRARFTKTRAAAARLVSEGGMRLVHNGVTRLIDKPSVEVAAGDALLWPRDGKLTAVLVKGLSARRGPASEARALYSEVDAQTLA
jgi:ribosomal 50S subunit-recycling heat shock protein